MGCLYNESLRRYLLTIFFLLGYLSTVLAQPSEEQLIKALNEKEGHYFINMNFEKWASCWVQNPEALFIYSDSENYFKLEGWKEISSTIQETMENILPKVAPDEMLLERDNYRIVIEGNIALVSYDQRDNFNGMQTKIENRVMKKVNGEWKILQINLIKTNTYNDN